MNKSHHIVLILVLVGFTNSIFTVHAMQRNKRKFDGFTPSIIPAEIAAIITKNMVSSQHQTLSSFYIEKLNSPGTSPYQKLQIKDSLAAALQSGYDSLRIADIASEHTAEEILSFIDTMYNFVNTPAEIALDATDTKINQDFNDLLVMYETIINAQRAIHQATAIPEKQAVVKSTLTAKEAELAHLQTQLTTLEGEIFNTYQESSIALQCTTATLVQCETSIKRIKSNLHHLQSTRISPDLEEELDGENIND